MQYQSRQKALVKELENSFAQNKAKSTIVDRQKDYANDEQITLTSVIFLPKIITDKISSEIIEPLKRIEPQHYYYPVGSMHLTIKNVRTIHQPPLFDQSDIAKVNTLFQKIIPQVPVFNFNVEDVLLFPTSIAVMAYSNNALQRLVLALDRGLKKIGVPDNKKYLSDSIFWGNITICRFTDNPSQQFFRAVKALRNIKIGMFKIEKICLLTCNAVCWPESRNIIAEYCLS